MSVLASIIDLAFTAYIYVILIQVAVSWLVAFDVINTTNEQAKNLIALLHKATDPVYKPIQKYVPPIGGIDLTPLIVVFGLSLVRGILMGIFL